MTKEKLKMFLRNQMKRILESEAWKGTDGKFREALLLYVCIGLIPAYLLIDLQGTISAILLLLWLICLGMFAGTFHHGPFYSEKEFEEYSRKQVEKDRVKEKRRIKGKPE